MENVDVYHRALDVYENLKTYVECSKSPDNLTVNTVKDAINDLLIPRKLLFFQYIASIVEPFLRIFQSDGPLAFFLYQELEKVMRSLTQNFIKTDILTEAKSAFKLMKIDLLQSKCNEREVHIGISTSSLLAKFKVSESRKSQFHDDCLKFYFGIVSNLREKDPFVYKLTRAVSPLNPVNICYSPDLGEKMINELLVILHDSKWINATTADRVNSQFQDFCGIAKVFNKKEL